MVGQGFNPDLLFMSHTACWQDEYIVSKGNNYCFNLKMSSENRDKSTTSFRSKYTTLDIPFGKFLDKWKIFWGSFHTSLLLSSLSLESLFVSAITSVSELLKCLHLELPLLLVCSQKFCFTFLPECVHGVLKLSISRCLFSILPILGFLYFTHF